MRIPPHYLNALPPLVDENFVARLEWVRFPDVQNDGEGRQHELVENGPGGRCVVGDVGRLARLVTFSGTVTDISGTDPNHVQFPTSEQALNYRPGSASDQTLTLSNLYIHDLTNQKALAIGASENADGTFDAYGNITLSNILIERVNRNAQGLINGQGVHIDGIRIGGGGTKQNVATNVTLNDVQVSDGNALPIYFTDGTYNTITLNDVSISNNTIGDVQFKDDTTGYIKHIVVENSPNLHLALMGIPGSIGDVTFINSPGATVDDTNPTGKGISVRQSLL